MPDLQQQLRSYVDVTIERIDVEDIAAVTAVGRPAPGWRRPLAVFAAAAAAVLLVIGGSALLLGGGADEPVTEPTPPPTTTIPQVTTVVTPAPPTSVAVPSTSTAGAADRVFDLALGSDGGLWAATAAGVVMWDLETASPTVFSERDGLPDRSVFFVAVAPDGTVWAVGPSWLARFDGTVWTELDESVLPDLPLPVGDLAVAPDGAVWVAAGNESLIRIEAESATTHRVRGTLRNAEPWTHSIAVDGAGTVWASAHESGLLSFDGEWVRYGVADGVPDLVGNVAVAPDGSVWVGGSGSYGEPGGDIPAGGILRYQDGRWTTYATADGLLSDGGSVTADPAGGVWVVHSALPAHIAEELGVELPAGISRFDGTSWQQYPSSGARGRGVVTADGTLWLPSEQGIVGFDGTSIQVLVAGPDVVPPLPGDVVSLERVEELDPVRLSTAIGEIEFTTWALPEEWEGLWHLTETPHGAVGLPYPQETRIGSLDGIDWTKTSAAGEPPGVATGPRGTVSVSIWGTTYSPDGVEFAEATVPPTRGYTADCSPPGWVSDSGPSLGPVVATDEGFVALAPRSKEVCEPLVWFSTDGDVWTLISETSPFGERSFVHDMVAVGNTIVAVGGVSRSEAAAWTTTDGVSWLRADVEAGELWQVAGGTRGWVLTGHLLPDGEVGEMWFSTDGLAWDGPYQRPPGWGDRAGLFYGVALLDDRIVGSGKQFDTPGMAMASAPPRVVVGVFVGD